MRVISEFEEVVEVGARVGRQPLQHLRAGHRSGRGTGDLEQLTRAIGALCHPQLRAEAAAPAQELLGVPGAAAQK